MGEPLPYYADACSSPLILDLWLTSRLGVCSLTVALSLEGNVVQADILRHYTYHLTIKERGTQRQSDLARYTQHSRTLGYSLVQMQSPGHTPDPAL